MSTLVVRKVWAKHVGAGRERSSEFGLGEHSGRNEPRCQFSTARGRFHLVAWLCSTTSTLASPRPPTRCQPSQMPVTLIPRRRLRSESSCAFADARRFAHVALTSPLELARRERSLSLSNSRLMYGCLRHQMDRSSGSLLFCMCEGDDRLTARPRTIVAARGSAWSLHALRQTCVDAFDSAWFLSHLHFT